MTLCKYPLGFGERNDTVHSCSNNATHNDYCVFHDKRRIAQNINEQQVIDLFHQQLDDCKKRNVEFICDGYILPYVHFDAEDLISASFHHAVFKDFVSISSTKKNILNFRNTHFNKGITLMGSCKEIYFEYAIFDELAHFNQVKFGLAMFSHSVFNGAVKFVNATFLEESHINDVVFKNKVNFTQTKFSMLANFAGSKFHSKCNFSESSFSRTDFGFCVFHDQATFTSAHFMDSIRFENTDFRHTVNFEYARFDSFVLFRRVTFSNTHEVLLEFNLSHTSFHNTTLGNNIRFGPRTEINKNFKILDELLIESEESVLKKIYESTFSELHGDYNTFRLPVDEIRKKLISNILIGDVVAQYNNLRENFEFHFKYDDAGNFFVRGSELSRIYMDDTKDIESDSSEKPTHFLIQKKSKSKQLLSVLFLYKLIANYGESYVRPLSIVFGIFLTSSIYFGLQCDVFENLSCMGISEHIEYGIKRGLSSTVPYLNFDGTVGALDYIIKSVTLPLVGISFIGLKRKFERKYRH